MTQIVLYTKDSSEYLYDLKASASYQSAIKPLKVDLSRIECNAEKDAFIIRCLHMLNACIQYEKAQRNFNIVRLMTIIDDLHNKMKLKYHYELARIFASEAVRLVLTHYDLTNQEFYSSSDWASLHRISAYPSESGKRVKLQRNEIIAAAEHYWDVDIIFRYPENYEYAKIGNYQELKKQFYADTALHDEHFKKGAEEAVVIIKPMPKKLVKRRLSFSEDNPQHRVSAQAKNNESEPFDPSCFSACLLSCCQFFDVAWPLAFFVPLVGWAYLAVRLVNGGSRLTNEPYSFFHNCFPEEKAQEEVVLEWNLTNGCFSIELC